MNPASVDIKDLLEAESSFGLTFATNLFIGSEPQQPDNCVTIYDTPGYPPELALEGAVQYFYPSIQIRVRNNSYLDAYDMINDIKTYLHGMNNFTVNGTDYDLIECSIEPHLLEWDKTGRSIFVITFNLRRR